MNAKDWTTLLAVESEWGKPTLVEEDFGKLLSIKCARKLLLFNTTNHENWESFLHPLEKMMQGYPYHLAGEEYMLLSKRRSNNRPRSAA